MFKTKEELMKGKILNKNYKGDGLDAYECGVYDAFKSFAERVEFYKKYRHTYPEDTSGMIMLLQEQPKIYEQYRKHLDTYNANYNLWLFDYCFGDIDKEK